jgi:hypothetical protein
MEHPDSAWMHGKTNLKSVLSSGFLFPNTAAQLGGAVA